MTSPAAPRFRALAVIASAVLVLGLATACSSGETTAKESDNSITVYSGRSEKLIKPILDAFTKQTGIAVEVRYGDSAELAAQLIEEGDKTPADVFLSQDAGALGAVAQAGLLGALPIGSIDAIPAEYRASDNTWVGVTGRARVIAYDGRTIKADEVPTSVLDLTKPKYKGQVAIAPTNASFQAFVTAMRLGEGEDVAKKWLEDMKANGVKSYEKNSQILDAVDKGQIDFGLINHYYWYEKAAEVGEDKMRAQIAFTEPGDAGSLVNVAGAGVLKPSIADADSLAFIDYLLSKPIQKAFVEKTKEYALVPGVAQVPGLAALESLKGPDVNLADLADLPATLKLLQEVGLT